MILMATDKAIKAFDAEIKRLLKTGKTPKEAVNEAYKLYPVMKIMQGEIEPQLIGEMKRGGAVGVAKPLLKKASNAVWAADGLTLSKRTTQGAKEVTKQAAAVIAEAVKKGQAVQKAALALFDGYGYGHTLPEQDIPDFLKQLTQIAKAKEYGGAEFHKTLRAVERNLKKLNVQGLKAAYTQVKNAVLSGNEKRIEKAVYTATQERTRYFARRIARTEMARAYDDGFMSKWASDEDCIAFKWKMSTAHPFCDICDMYAEADLYGMGPGIFPKDRVPTLPVHPNCMCHLRPVMVGSKLLKSETPRARIEDGGREWLNKQTLPNRQRILGVYGEKDVKAGRSWTEKARGYSGEKMKSRIVLVIPNEFKNPDKLVIPENKLVNYCLNKAHKTGGPKAVAFEKYLGYTQENSKKLDELIRKNITTAEIMERKADEYGRTFQARFFVVDLQGKKILMVTGWKQGARDEYPRLTSAYLKPEKKGDVER